MVDCDHVSGLLTRRACPLAQMGSAIQPQTMTRLRKPLRGTGSLDPRIDRLSSHCALSPRHRRAVRPRASVARAERAISSAHPGADGQSITAEAARWFNRLQLAQVEFADRPQCFRGRAVFQADRQARQPCRVSLLRGGDRGDPVGPLPGQPATVGGAAHVAWSGASAHGGIFGEVERWAAAGLIGAVPGLELLGRQVPGWGIAIWGLLCWQAWSVPTRRAHA